jgi:catechol 2,3-dioxygenase-like lactoylglutathione lyase family enzyme
VGFATDVLGLRETARVGGSSYLTCNERHHELVLVADVRAALDHVALDVVGSEELERLRDALEQEGAQVLSDEPEEPGIRTALRVLGPGGHTFELLEGMEVGQPSGYATFGVRPSKFSHVALKTDDIPAMEDFLVRVLGFRVSTRVGEAVWLRCNSEHHAIALFPGANQLHHYAWEVAGWGTIEQIGDHLWANGYKLYFGPGRHGPGRSIFAYFRDPEGFLAEYATEFERIDNESSYRPESFPSELEAINRWGLLPPNDFMELGTGVVERASAGASGQG